MGKIFINQPVIVNEGKQYVANVLITDGFIEVIGGAEPTDDCEVIDGTGKYLLPGVIDSHVHFREPGLTHKGDIFSESKAAVAGGVTSFIDMPNTLPNAITAAMLENKYELAHNRSFANYGFHLGATTSAIDEMGSIDASMVPAITDDGLYFTNNKSLLADQPELLRELLSNTSKVISLHIENEELIDRNIAEALQKYGEDIPAEAHAVIRSEPACVMAAEAVLEQWRQTKGRLHMLHLSTAKEARMLDANADITQKRLTAEVCIHHLWFSDDDYKELGMKIKWNPSIKTKEDREELLKAVMDDRIDIISTDHAPHLLTEKLQPYTKSASGAPMVQHSLVVMLELVKRKQMTIEKIVEKMCHNPARLFDIDKRGFIKEGYYADVVLLDTFTHWKVEPANILYKCGWSPLEGVSFSSKVYCTIVNGKVAYKDGVVVAEPNGVPLLFNANRKI